MDFGYLEIDKKLSPCLAQFFSWTELGELCSTMLTSALRRLVSVAAVKQGQGSAWVLKLIDNALSQEELYTLMDALDANGQGQETREDVWEIPQSLSYTLVAKAIPFYAKEAHAVDDGVWFTGTVGSEVPSNVYAVLVVRQRQDGVGTELYFSSYLVDEQQLPKADPEKCADLLRQIAFDFLKTEDGRAAYEETCKDFNWGDMETYIPDAFFKPYGVARCDGCVYPCCGVIGVLVNQDELLGDGIWENDAHWCEMD